MTDRYLGRYSRWRRKSHRLAVFTSFLFCSTVGFASAVPSSPSTQPTRENAIQPSIGPGPRTGHCSFAFHGQFYVYGGIGSEPNSSNFSSVHIPIPNNITTIPWTAIDSSLAKGVVHGACEVTPSGHVIILGYDPQVKDTSDTAGYQTYTFATRSWVPTPAPGINIPKAFSKRKGMATAMVGKKLVVFGGITENGSYEKNGVPPSVAATNGTRDTFVLDTSNGIHDWQWYHIPSTKDTPPASAYTTFAAVDGHRAYHFSLERINGTLTNVVRLFDTNDMEWTSLLRPMGTQFERLLPANYDNEELILVPSVTSAASLAKLDNTPWAWNLTTNNITQLKLNYTVDPSSTTKGPSQSKYMRRDASGPLTYTFQPGADATMDVVGGDSMIFYGGQGDNGSYVNNFYQFNLTSLTFSWSYPPPKAVAATIPSTNTTASNTGPTESAVLAATSQGRNTLGIILGTVIAGVAVILLAGFFVYTRHRQHQREAIYAVPYNDPVAGGTRANSADIDGAARRLAHDERDAHTWAQTLRNILLGVSATSAAEAIAHHGHEKPPTLHSARYTFSDSTLGETAGENYAYGGESPAPTEPLPAKPSRPPKSGLRQEANVSRQGSVSSRFQEVFGDAQPLSSPPLVIGTAPAALSTPESGDSEDPYRVQSQSRPYSGSDHLSPLTPPPRMSLLNARSNSDGLTAITGSASGSSHAQSGESGQEMTPSEDVTPPALAVPKENAFRRSW